MKPLHGDKYRALGLALASEAHCGQYRNPLPDPYVVHPARVAQAARACGANVDVEVAAYLHDVLEDCPTWSANALRQAGVSDRSLDLIRLLTKPVPEDKDTYYAGILSDDDAVLLKLLDRTDNLSDMRKVVQRYASKRGWAQSYYEKTVREFPPLLAASRSILAVGRYSSALSALRTALDKKGE